MKTINKLFLYLLITTMVFCQNVFSKSLPPGSGSGDAMMAKENDKDKDG